MYRNNYPPSHFDIVNTEDGGPSQHAGNNARGRGWIAVVRIGYPKNLSDDTLARNGQEKWTSELVELVELTKDSQIIADLLGKVDPWVENDPFARHTSPFRNCDLVTKEPQHFINGVLVKDVGVRNLRRSDGVDNEQRSPGLRAELRIAVIVQGAEIVKQMPAGAECDPGYFRSPGIDRQQGGKYLFSVSRRDVSPDFLDPLQKGTQAAQLLLRRDGGSVGPGAFAAHVDDVRSLGNEPTCRLQSPLGIDLPVPAKGVIVDIDDSHDQWASGEADASVTGKQFHLVLGSILFQAWCLLQQP